jgi:hypothetical protein
MPIHHVTYAMPNARNAQRKLYICYKGACRGQPRGSPKTTGGILLKTCKKPKQDTSHLSTHPRDGPHRGGPRGPSEWPSRGLPRAGSALLEGPHLPRAGSASLGASRQPSSELCLARGLTPPASGLHLARGFTSTSHEASARARPFLHAGTDI